MEVEQEEGSNDSSDEESELKPQSMVQNGVGRDDDSENVEGSESDEGEGGDEEDEGEEMEPAEIANGAEADSESSDGEEDDPSSLHDRQWLFEKRKGEACCNR